MISLFQLGQLEHGSRCGKLHLASTHLSLGYSEPSQCSPFRLVNKIVDSDDLLWVYGPSPPDCESDNVEHSALDYLSVVAYVIGNTDHLQKMLNNDSHGLINKAVHQLQVEN